MNKKAILLYYIFFINLSGVLFFLQYMGLFDFSSIFFGLFDDRTAALTIMFLLSPPILLLTLQKTKLKKILIMAGAIILNYLVLYSFLVYCFSIAAH